MLGILNEFLSCLFFILGIGIVIKDFEVEEIWDVVDRFVLNVVKCMIDSYLKMCCILYYVGSLVEEIKIKFFDEFDYVVCFDEMSENIYLKYEIEDVFESVYFVLDREICD